MKLCFYNFMKNYSNNFTQATPIHPSYRASYQCQQPFWCDDHLFS